PRRPFDASGSESVYPFAHLRFVLRAGFRASAGFIHRDPNSALPLAAPRGAPQSINPDGLGAGDEDASSGIALLRRLPERDEQRRAPRERRDRGAIHQVLNSFIF